MTNIDTPPPSEHKKFEDFVNRAVHELKTPVTVLKAYLQMIAVQLRRENQPGYIKTVDKMDIQLDKLLNLIADLQDGVKANSEDIHCLMNDFYINESIRICADSVQATNPACTITMELDDSNPLIRGDKDRIEQVLNNFLNNAIKYSGSRKELGIKSVIQQGKLLVSVSDNGMGIPPEKQPYIFQQFYRVESTSAKQQPGLGLGLFISSEIIRRHNGEIGVNSVEGEGSEFWFTLPVH